jgi:hypothetical protein
MKSIHIIIVLVAFSLPMNAQILKKAQKFIEQSGSGYSEDEAASAIKEALTNGTGNSVKLVSQQDGYFKNLEIKIPFPSEARNMETKLRSIGMGDKVDEFVLSINRAAEDAANEAKPIFVTAIKNMTVRDAINIVKGEDDAATQYLDKNTSNQLAAKFQPKIEVSLEKVNATKYWDDLVTAYNKIPFVQKMNPDLAEYVTEKAIDGMFIMIAKEEKKIREDPLARTSDLLRKVFGN